MRERKGVLRQSMTNGVGVAWQWQWQWEFIINYPLSIINSHSPFSIILFTLWVGFSIMGAFGTLWRGVLGKGGATGAGIGRLPWENRVFFV